MEDVLKYLRLRTEVPSELDQAIQAKAVKEQLGKKEVIARANQVCRKLYFISSGCIRSYYYGKNDKQVSSWFYEEQQFVTCWSSFYSGQTSFEYLETVEDCELYSIDASDFQELIRNYPAFERFARLLVEEQLVFLDTYFKGYMFLSAKERYDLLLSYFPGIELRVGLGHIASFLGISIETLSRIRSHK